MAGNTEDVHDDRQSSDEEFLTAFSEKSLSSTVPHEQPLEAPEEFQRRLASAKRSLAKSHRILYRESGVVGGLELAMRTQPRSYPSFELELRASGLRHLASVHRQFENRLNGLKPTVAALQLLQECEPGIERLAQQCTPSVLEKILKCPERSATRQ